LKWLAELQDRTKLVSLVRVVSWVLELVQAVKQIRLNLNRVAAAAAQAYLDREKKK
jgi:hypothetical protein